MHGMDKNANDRHKEAINTGHAGVGWKYNMDNIQAALLLPQMDRLDDNWESVVNWRASTKATLGHSRSVTAKTLPGSTMRASLPVWIGAGRRDEVIQRMQRWDWRDGKLPRHSSPDLLSRDFGFKTGDFPNAELIGDNTCRFPFIPTCRWSTSNACETSARFSVKPGLLSPGRIVAVSWTHRSRFHE